MKRFLRRWAGVWVAILWGAPGVVFEGLAAEGSVSAGTGAGSGSAAAGGVTAAVAGVERTLFDGKTLAGWAVTPFAGKGEVSVENGLLVLREGYLTGVHWTNAVPANNYEISLEARRVTGNDFFCGLTFPIAGTNASLIVGGWGGGLVGISSIDGNDASSNDTTKFMSFQKDRWYAVRVRVTSGKLEAWLDQEKVVDVVREDKKFSLRSGPIEESVPLGICTYETGAHLRNIVLRELSGGSAAPATGGGQDKGKEKQKENAGAGAGSAAPKP